MTQIDQQWLDKNCYSVPADLEPALQELAGEAEALAYCEHKLIESVKENKRQLERLPQIIANLEIQHRERLPQIISIQEAQLRGVGNDLAEVFERHDRLAEAHKLLSARQQPTEAEA